MEIKRFLRSREEVDFFLHLKFHKKGIFGDQEGLKKEISH